MSLYRAFAAVLVASLLLVSWVAARESDWEMVAIAGSGEARELLTIGPDGIRERVTLSPDFPANYEQLALSSDGRLLATIPAQWNRVVVATADGGECCTELQFAEDEVLLSTLAGFSLDGSQLAISYVSEVPLRSEMLVLDVGTGEVVTRVDTTELSSSDPNFVTYPVLIEWALDGVHFVTSCIQCVDATMPENIYTWDPATGTERSTGLLYNYRTDRLAFAPAVLTPVFALDYPSAADAEAIFWGAQAFGVRNAVLLTSARAENGRAVVYATDEHSNLIARWGANGDAILVFFNNDLPGSGELVLPDGSIQPLDFPASQFLAGTPDGWVRKQGTQLVHDWLDGATVTTTELGEYAGTIRVLHAPPLGAHGGSAFVTVPPLEPVTCDGFVESRLVVGHLGRVLPGPANNLRAEPTTGSEIIAKMAGTEEFAILEGPVCAQGLAWWRVQFKQWEGWTAEGSGRNYWLELAPDLGYRAPAG